MSEIIDIIKIRTDGGTQSRAQMDNDTISEYVDHWKAGGEFPDIGLYFDGAEYWIFDGYHRLESAKLAGKTTINADVRQGTRRDAVLASAGANSTHGLKRTNADKRRAVLLLLEDEEWSMWSSHEIGRRTGVSNKTVDNIRHELSVKNSQMKLPDETRLVTRGGKTYEMKVQQRPASDDNALLLALYNWNDAIGPAMPAHLASKARNAEQIADDLAALVKNGFADLLQTPSDSGIKALCVITQAGCDLIKKPFPAKIQRAEIVESATADGGQDAPVQPEQPAAQGLEVGDVTEFYIGYSAKVGQLVDILPNGDLLIDCISMARGDGEQFTKSVVSKARLATDTKYAHWFTLRNQAGKNDVVVFAWKNHYITFNSGSTLGWNRFGFGWQPKESWDKGLAWRLSEAFIDKLRADGINVVIFADIDALPERMQQIVRKVGRSRGGEIAEPLQETPDFKVGDSVISPIGAVVTITEINGRFVKATGRNGERNYYIDTLKPAPDTQTDENTAITPANQPDETCPDCGGDLWQAGASTMIDNVSYCVDCGLKRLPEPAAAEPPAEIVESATADGGDEPAIEVILGWLMGYEIYGTSAPDNMQDMIEQARRWLDALEDRFVNELVEA